jgi:hypothetical protein
VELLDYIGTLWPVGLSSITLVIVLAKIHSEIDILKEKIKTLFELFNDFRTK